MEDYVSFIIEKTLNNIQAKGLPVPNLNIVDLEDGNTYKLLGSGNTHGIYECQRQDDKYYLQLIKPKCFTDLVAYIALNSHGGIESDMILDFINRKNPKMKIDYVSFGLRFILNETYGLILYREQIKAITYKISKFKEEQGVLFLNNLLKRIPEVIKKDKIKFLKAAEFNGVPLKRSGKIYGLMKKYAPYTKERDHIERIALQAYKMAYLKAHYPNEFK
jgi:DNA polymerase III subunit alpha